MYKSYRYEGPLPLGSVVAQNCSATGFFSAKKNVDLHLSAVETNDSYVLTVQWLSKASSTTLQGPISSTGRRTIGNALLRWLRTLEGLSPYPLWGTLVGMRPTKVYHKAVDQGIEDIPQYLLNTYHMDTSKSTLLSTIGALQMPYITYPSVEAGKKAVSIYVGIPFCHTQCVYCSFPFGLYGDYQRHEAFMSALMKDIAHVQSLVERYELDVKSIYVGGGTPTVLPERDFHRLLEALVPLHTPGIEWTVEAGRPDSITPTKVASMNTCGVNRMSINPQSMDDGILQRIGRGHAAKDIERMYDYVRSHSEMAVNMDFIAGLPGQTVAHMEQNLDYIEQAMPSNVTVHTLALKRGAPLYERRGDFQLAEDDAVRHMVDSSRERLLSLGYVPYYVYRQKYMTDPLENIGYTLPNQECAYNIYSMEERQTILGVGPGSSSKWMAPPLFRQEKQFMPKDVDVYIDTLPQLLHKREITSSSFWEVI